MNFDLNPMQPATSPFATLTTLTGGSQSDDFAALLDRSAIASATPEQKAASGEVIAVTQEATTSGMAEHVLASLPKIAADATVVKGDVIAGKAEPTADLDAIAKADALVARLTPAPKETEKPTAAFDDKPVPPALAETARFPAQAEFARSDRKGVRNEGGRQPSTDSADESEADETRQSAPSAPEVVKVAIDQVPLPLLLSTPPVDQSPSRPRPEKVASLISSERQNATLTAAPLPTVTTDIAPPQKETPRAEGPNSKDQLTDRVELPRRVIEASQDISVQDSAELDMPKILNALAAAQEKGISVPKAAPVRAAKIAEIAIGLADAQPIANPVAVHASTPELATAAARATADIVPSDAPVRGTVVDRQLDLIRNEQWLGELAHDIASTTGDANRLSFRLMPHQLGRLDVDVSRSHNGLSLIIQTESDSAKTILSAVQTRLTDEIRAQGVKVADTQMFSGDARQSPSQDGFTRPAPLIETFISPNETVDVPEPEQRDGRYA